MRLIFYLLLFLMIGFAVGYGIFGQVDNRYVHPLHFFAPHEEFSERLRAAIFAVNAKRQNILISTAIGGALGLLLGAITQKKKK